MYIQFKYMSIIITTQDGSISKKKDLCDSNNLRVIIDWKIILSPLNVNVVASDIVYELICDYKCKLTKMELEQILSQILLHNCNNDVAKIQDMLFSHMHKKNRLSALKIYVNSSMANQNFGNFSILRTLEWVPTSQMGKILHNLTHFDSIPPNCNNTAYTVNMYMLCNDQLNNDNNWQCDCYFEFDIQVEDKQHITPIKNLPCKFMVRNNRPCNSVEYHESTR